MKVEYTGYPGTCPGVYPTKKDVCCWSEVKWTTETYVWAEKLNREGYCSVYYNG